MKRSRLAVVLAATLATTTALAQPAAIAVRPVAVAPSLKTVLAGKKRYDPAKLATFLRVDADGPIYRHGGRDYRLMPTQPTTQKLARAAQQVFPPKLAARQMEINAWRPGQKLSAVATRMADHRSWQSPVRDQGGRGTCSAFATVAGTEALLRRRMRLSSPNAGEASPTRLTAAAVPEIKRVMPSVDLDISENHAFKAALTKTGEPCQTTRGVHTWATVDAALDGLCVESAFPYTQTCPTSGIPVPCSASATRKLSAVWPMYTPNHGVPEVQEDWSHRADNIALLESLLDTGADVIYALDIAGGDWNSNAVNSGVIDVEVDENGNPAPAAGSHAMLMVGYNRLGKYFIFKNSWGADYGRAGYIHISYDYVQTYAWYGFATLD